MVERIVRVICDDCGASVEVAALNPILAGRAAELGARQQGWSLRPAALHDLCRACRCLEASRAAS